jgi:hypothetical protein
MTNARVLYVHVQLLDHQILDRDGVFAGKVDDAEIRLRSDGSATLDALLSGPGVLANRLGHRRFGRWRERLESALEPPGERTTRIATALVRRIDTAVHLSIEASDLASHGTERWVRAHVIARIPGSSIGDGTPHD